MEKLTQLTNELIDWLNREVPAVFPTNDNLPSDFCKELRSKLDIIEQQKQIVMARANESFIEDILNETARRSGFTVAELKGKSREVELVMCRYFFFKRAKDKTKAYSTTIGRCVNRNHSTVLHGLNKIETERLQHGTLLDEYNKFWDDKPKSEVVVTKVICEPLPSEHFIDRPVKREFETSGFMAFNGYKEHQI